MEKVIAIVGIVLALGASWLAIKTAGWMFPYYLTLYFFALVASILLFVKKQTNLAILVLAVTVLTFGGSWFLVNKWWNDVYAGKVFRSVGSPVPVYSSESGRTNGGTGTANP